MDPVWNHYPAQLSDGEQGLLPVTQSFRTRTPFQYTRSHSRSKHYSRCPFSEMARSARSVRNLRPHFTDYKKTTHMTYTVQVKVMPLKELLDPQGKAVMGGLQSLGLPAVTDVRVG